MTTTTGDAGGYAFPHDEKDGGGQHWQTHDGMTLRDYFAAQALCGPVADYRQTECLSGETIAQMLARKSYELADAILEARKR